MFRRWPLKSVLNFLLQAVKNSEMFVKKSEDFLSLAYRQGMFPPEAGKTIGREVNKNTARWLADFVKHLSRFKNNSKIT